MAHSQPAVVMVATRVLALLCCAAIAAGMNMCAQYSTCGKCTAAPFCGWCSPGPIIYRNGSSGARCGDERDLPWNCPQHYSTETCSEGYHCFENNTLVPKCLAQGKGEGNFTSKTSCEKACVLANHTGNHSNHTPVPPPPPVKHGGFKCNITTNSTGGMVGMCLKVRARCCAVVVCAGRTQRSPRLQARAVLVRGRVRFIILGSIREGWLILLVRCRSSRPTRLHRSRTLPAATRRATRTRWGATHPSIARGERREDRADREERREDSEQTAQRVGH